VKVYVLKGLVSITGIRMIFMFTVRYTPVLQSALAPLHSVLNSFYLWVKGGGDPRRPGSSHVGFCDGQKWG
jgi:hypothetical protein